MHHKYSHINILLVEDDDLDALAIRRGFSKQKLTNAVFRAKNGIEALAMLRGENGYEHVTRPFVILLDLNMPQMGGLEFLTILRQDQVLQHSIVFVLTTSSADEDKTAAYNKQIAGYLVKTDLRHSFTKLVDLLDHYSQLV